MSKFKSLLMQPLLKAAGPDNPDSTQFEKDFSGIAYAFIRDKAAALLDFMIGFEVVEREEDGSKAVGVFGFKIGDNFFYIPIFFLNSQIKGVDLIFSRTKNEFMPLTENWVSSLINKSPMQIGQSVAPEQVQQLRQDFSAPNFRFVSIPPTLSPKWAADDLCAFWNESRDQISEMLEKNADFQQAYIGAVCAITAPEELKNLPGDSLLINHLRKHGTVNDLERIANWFGNFEFAKCATTFYSPEDLFPEIPQQEKKAKKLTIVTQVSEWDPKKNKDVKKLVRDGFVIEDGREPEEKSDIYDIEYDKHFANPDESGVYDVLLTSGSCIECYVVKIAPKTTINTVRGAVVVVDKKNKRYFTAENGLVFVRDSKKEGKVYDDAKDIKKMEIGKRYVLVNEADNGGPLIKVEAAILESNKPIMYKVNTDSYIDYKNRSFGADVKSPTLFDDSYSSCESIKTIVLSDSKSRIIGTPMHGKLVIGSNWKALELDDMRDLEYTERESHKSAFQPGNMTDVSVALMKAGMHQLTVYNDGTDEFSISLNGMREAEPHMFKSAVIRLVTNYGLDEQDARDILKEAKEEFKSKRMIKLAQNASMPRDNVGVSMNEYPPEQVGYDDYTGAPVQWGIDQTTRGKFTGVPPLRPALTKGMNMAPQPGPGQPLAIDQMGRPYPGPDDSTGQTAQQLAQQAAQTGQKNVFDVATISGLSKLYDSSAVIDSYLPILSRALDHLGRVLFLFYWKNDEFVERYGVNDIQEMEDLMRSVFKSFGDLVLKLKEKTITEDPGEGEL